LNAACDLNAYFHSIVSLRCMQEQQTSSDERDRRPSSAGAEGKQTSKIIISPEEGVSDAKAITRERAPLVRQISPARRCQRRIACAHAHALWRPRGLLRGGALELLRRRALPG